VCVLPYPISRCLLLCYSGWGKRPTVTPKPRPRLCCFLCAFSPQFLPCHSCLFLALYYHYLLLSHVTFHLGGESDDNSGNMIPLLRKHYFIPFSSHIISSSSQFFSLASLHIFLAMVLTDDVVDDDLFHKKFEHWTRKRLVIHPYVHSDACIQFVMVWAHTPNIKFNKYVFIHKESPLYFIIFISVLLTTERKTSVKSNIASQTVSYFAQWWRWHCDMLALKFNSINIFVHRDFHLGYGIAGGYGMYH